MSKVVPVDDDSLVPGFSSHNESKSKVVPIIEPQRTISKEGQQKTTKDFKDFRSTLMKVLQGYSDEYDEIKTNYYTININSIDTETIYKESYKLKVFVSSTFTDTHEGLSYHQSLLSLSLLLLLLLLLLFL